MLIIVNQPSRRGIVMTKKKKEVKIVKCQKCNKPKEKCVDWNSYYMCCEGCL